MTSGERGGVTAELAVALPAVMILLATCLSGIAVAGQQLRVQDAAALAARTLGRSGDPHALASRLLPGAQVTPSADGDLACVTVALPARGLPITLTARSCALDAGR